MPSNKPVFTLRTEQLNLDKLHIIALHDNRSDNRMLERILLNAIREYENIYGIIQTEETER